MISYLLGASFAIMVACVLTCAVCGVFLFFVSWRSINDAFAHPLLQVKPFKRYPFALQAAIYLDYFLRLMFPNGKSGMVGNANHLLRHVDAKRLPLSVRLPVAGFWGGCLLGIVAMVSVWILLLLGGGA